MMDKTELDDVLTELSASREKAELMVDRIIESEPPREIQMLAYIANDYIMAIKQTVETLHREFAI